MNEKPRILDLFCGAGGCAKGYQRAGFYVVGVDNKEQPRYCGEEFVQADALEFVADHGAEFDAIHASPPCQGYSRMRHLPWLKGRVYPMLIDETRDILEHVGKPWVIENVEDSGRHMGGSIMLCGTMFGLKVYRHRLFMSSEWLWQPPHAKHKEVIGSSRFLNDRAQPNANGFVSLPSKERKNGLRDGATVCVAGHFGGMTAAKAAMGIDWMKRSELAQAIPPAYTELVGRRILESIERSKAEGVL